jgi:hypothetical protein
MRGGLAACVLSAALARGAVRAANATCGEDGEACSSRGAFTRCWARAGATFGDDKACDLSNPTSDKCLDLRAANPVPCPEGLAVEWSVPDARIKQGAAFESEAVLVLSEAWRSRLAAAPCGGGEALVAHANVHGCQERATSWWCQELIPAYQPRGAVSTSPAQCLNKTSAQFSMTVDGSTPAAPNEWTLYAHFTLWVRDEQGAGLIKWHLTHGAVFSVEGRTLGISGTTLALSQSLAAATGLVAAAALAVVLWNRRHWVIVASSFHMSVVVLLGALLGGVAVLAFIPPLHESAAGDLACLMRQWLTPLAFDLLVLPLCLKTWRVHRIFSNTAMKRVKITNAMLISGLAAVLGLEVAFNTVWTALPAARLRVGRSFSSLDPNAFELDCVSDSPALQRALTAASVALHSIPLLMLTMFAYKVRLSFKYAAFNKKHNEFDESLYIMLTLLNIAVAGGFVLVFTSSIDSNPDAITTMRCGGIAWICVLTTALMFGPKFMSLAAWDAEGRDAAKRAVAVDDGSSSDHSSETHDEPTISAPYAPSASAV